MGRKKIDRIGEINVSNEGYEMKIVECNSYNNIVIEFQDEHEAKVHTQYNNFKNGQVKNPYHPCVFGIGCLGQGRYKASVNKRHTKAYVHWKNMIKRCYDPYELNKRPTYIDCYVCDEWLCFQNFAKWFYKHYYKCNNEKMNLDKDILFKGNKIYSPETCIFSPERINTLFTKSNARRGGYPIGVSPHKRDNVLVVQCSILKGHKYLGCFPVDKPFQAFTVYKNFKEKYIKQIADEYKELIPKELYDALYKYEVEIND